MVADKDREKKAAEWGGERASFAGASSGEDGAVQNGVKVGERGQNGERGSEGREEGGRPPLLWRPKEERREMDGEAGKRVVTSPSAFFRGLVSPSISLSH